MVPTHQRITSSKLWVLDHRQESAARSAGRTAPQGGPANDREAKRRLKELETARLQMEYDSVKLENDKLKKVIARLRQEIQVYNGLLGEQPEQPPLQDLLVTSKRRKQSREPPAEPAVSSDDVLLMNTLTDVLAQMEH